VDVAAIVVWQQRRRVQVDLGGDAQRVRHVGFFALLERSDGGGQHVIIQTETDLLHLTAL